MSLVSFSQFLEIYEQFSQVNLNKIQHLLDKAERNFVVDNNAWGVDRTKREAKRRDAIMLLCAHWITAGWEQTAKTTSNAAAASTGKGVSTSSEFDDFTTTQYGREYLEMRKTVSSVGIVT